MLSEVKKRFEGPKFNIDFGGKGLGQTGEGDKCIHYAKRDHFTEVCQHFCPSLHVLLFSSGVENMVYGSFLLQFVL